jgi:CRISPR/Cas system-associated endonuclease Cas1
MNKRKELSDQQKDAMAAMEAELRKLKKENSRLEYKVRMARIKADLYDEMINVAEKQFNIKIRTKVDPEK